MEDAPPEASGVEEAATDSSIISVCDSDSDSSQVDAQRYFFASERSGILGCNKLKPTVPVHGV